MKKIAQGILIGLCFLFIFLASCGQEQPQKAESRRPAREPLLTKQKQEEVKVYFATKDYRYLVPVTFNISATTGAAQVAVEKLLAGPSDEVLAPVFPEETKLRQLYLSEETAWVDLTAAATNLSEPKRMAQALEALTLTLTEFPGVTRVQVLIEGQKRETIGGVAVGSPLSRPEAINPLGEGNMVTVYFTDKQALYLIPVAVPVPSTLAQASPGEQALRLLLAGPPPESRLGRTVWPGTKLLGFSVEGSLATLNFSKEVVGYGGGSTAESLLVKSVVLTVTEIPGITRVQFLIEGQRQSYLPEGTEIKEPLPRPSLVNLIR